MQPLIHFVLQEYGIVPMKGVLNGLLWFASWVLGKLIPKKKGLFIFGGRQYGGNTAPLFERSSDFELDGYWLTGRDDVLSMGLDRCYSTRSFRGLMLVLRAEAVVLTHSLGDFSPLTFSSRRTRIINVWHGMPIKRISTADPQFMERKHARSNLREMARFECMVATSSEMAALFSHTFRLKSHQVHITGQPRTDLLFGGQVRDIAAAYTPALPAHSKRILYCPTWRENTAVKLFPFADYDLHAINQRLEELDAIIYIRTHPNDPGRWQARSGRVVPMQSDVAPEVTDVLPQFNVLVTDYSSVYYDYLLLNRPTVFLPYDLNAYAKAPGFYLPFERIAPGHHPETQNGFLDALEKALSEPEKIMESQRVVADLVHKYKDGLATERLLNVLSNGS
ncbi:MAG: CDP-glycerol glycerophosphotransferase family protein [Myxococcota bacterium]|nr:CDP-glycerol glycerophosphotransferase family protein [Myxococcota bacterium]